LEIYFQLLFGRRGSRTRLTYRAPVTVREVSTAAVDQPVGAFAFK
jgi:hypothetical protein